MHSHERIHGFLIFRPAHTKGLAILGDPAWFKRLCIRPHPQSFTRPQAGERFKHHLPAQRFGAAVGKHQRRDFMQGFGIVRHEITAVLDVLGATIPWASKRQGVMLDKIAPHAPKQRVAQGVQLQVHGPVAPPIRGILLTPSVITVKFNQGNFTRAHFVPEFEQDRTIPRFHLQGAANAGLFLPVGETVLLVAADDFSQQHGSLRLFHFGNTAPRQATMQFLTGVFEVLGFQGAPRPFPVRLGAVKICARSDVSIKAGFHPLKLSGPDPDDCAGGFHVVFAFLVWRDTTRNFSTGEKDVV